MKISELPKFTPHNTGELFDTGMYFLVNYQGEDQAATTTVATGDVARLMRAGTPLYDEYTQSFYNIDNSGAPARLWRFSLGNLQEMSSDESWGHGHEYCLPIFVDVKDGKAEVYFNDPGSESKYFIYWYSPNDSKPLGFSTTIMSDECLPVCYIPGESRLFYYDLYNRAHIALSGIKVNTEGTVK